MAGTRIVAVRSALFAGLGELTDDELDGVEIDFQYRAGSNARERVFTRRARATQTSAAMKAGRNFRNETGRFEVVALVEGVGQTAEWTATRAVEIGTPVEEYIADRKNNELGVTGLQTLVVDGDLEIVELFNDSGHMAELVIPVRYTARLT